MNNIKNLSLLSLINVPSTRTINSLYALSEKSHIAAIIFIIITTLILYNNLGYSIFIWALSSISIFLYRLYKSYQFKHYPQKYTQTQWYVHFVITSLLSASILSILGSYFLSTMNDTNQIFVIVALLGFSAGASISLSSEFKIAISYISIIMLPLIITFMMQNNPLHIILPVMLILFYFSQIMLILKNYTQDEQIRELVDLNEELLNENKQFIADMVHQIRTPLSTIMFNTSLMEMKSGTHSSNNIKQINSAINMLNNAFEDLSYIISNDTIEYKPIQIDFSAFVEKRIDFFRVTIQHHYKKINIHISPNISIFMNDTELERLIDNNITNAIKHSKEYSLIEVFLSKTHTQIILKFTSQGKKIQNITKIFDKNYTEINSEKRSLGLGLYMVKNICIKNNIIYLAESYKDLNTFTYIFHI